MPYDDLPGAELCEAAVKDLRAGVESPTILLASLARGRLVDAGLAVPPSSGQRPELYRFPAIDPPRSALQLDEALHPPGLLSFRAAPGSVVSRS